MLPFRALVFDKSGVVYRILINFACASLSIKKVNQANNKATLYPNGPLRLCKGALHFEFEPIHSIDLRFSRSFYFFTHQNFSAQILCYGSTLLIHPINHKGMTSHNTTRIWHHN